MANLFEAAGLEKAAPSRPLAEELRPKSLAEVVGQDHLLGPPGPIGRMLAQGRLSSMVLWGPPGTGKTTIARLLAGAVKLDFEAVSAIYSGVADLRKVFETAKARRLTGRGTLLFVDEIHRFNRAQLDSFLPGTPLAVFGQSCRLLVWPWPLSWDYSYAAIENVHHWSEPRLWAGAAILAGCLAGMVVSWRRRRVVFAAVGLALVSYFIVSNTLMLIGAVFAERYLYLPSAGFCMLVGCAVAAVARRGTKSESASVAGRRRRFACLVAAMLGLVIVAGGAATMARNRDFVSNAVLDAADVRTQPRSARLWTATAVDALNGGDRRLALERASQALAICPLDMRAWRVSARAHWELKENAAALECANKVFEAVGFTDAALVVVAGDIYQAQGDYARAIAILESFASGSGGREGPTRGEPVLDLGPQTATAYNNLAWYLLVAQPPELRDPQRALRYAERAVAIKPAAGDFLDTYVSVLQALGRVEDARRVLDAALPMIPASDQFRDGLLRKRQEL